MELQYSELESNLRSIRLTGSLDIFGVGGVETKFAGYCAGPQPQVMVDLSGVDFIASIGIRMLMITAKSIASRGGRMALLGPIPEVRSVLEVTGVPAVIPVYDDLESARAALLA